MSIYSQLASTIRRDPAQRGLATAAQLAQFGGAESLERAAKSLALEGHSVGIVTGFPVVIDEQAVAETDGPSGAIMLASVLHALGRDVRLISDAFCLPALSVACDVCRLPQSLLLELDARQMPRATHLVAIERPGPTHTLETFLAQPRTGEPPIERFNRALPAELRDRPLNMRGEPLDAYTAPAHRLFELAADFTPRIETVGIGDGGNEIGMGAIPWETLDAVLGERGARHVACRIATDELILAGVSNWGGYALAAAVAYAAERLDTFAPCTMARERTVIESIVRLAGAVDGVTRRREPTVDGLPLDVHLALLTEIRGILRLDL